MNFSGGTEQVAKRLLGGVLSCGTGADRCAGRIVETEAYLACGDEASHSHRGETARNASMFLRAGHAYVYLIYGIHLCFNVVTGPAGRGEAVLIRALEPLEGFNLMARRRGTEQRNELCNGPGKLAQALGIERADDGANLAAGRIQIAPGSRRANESVCSGPRIGISKATQLNLRFRFAE